MMLAEFGVNSLSLFPKVSLFLFLGVFVAITVRALRRPKSEMKGCAMLPLDETMPDVDDTNAEQGDA